MKTIDSLTSQDLQEAKIIAELENAKNCIRFWIQQRDKYSKQLTELWGKWK